MKPVVRSALATSDIEDALAFYLQESSEVAMKFVDELERSVRHIEAHPAAGMTRYSTELGVTGLRYWPLRKFPYALFYFESEDHVRVIRFVHLRRDIPASLREDR